MYRPAFAREVAVGLSAARDRLPSRPDAEIESRLAESAAAPRPIKGAGRVAAFLSGLGKRVGAFEANPMWLNGGPAMRIDLDTRLDTVASLLVEDGRITRIFAIRNPEKLRPWTTG